MWFTSIMRELFIFKVHAETPHSNRVYYKRCIPSGFQCGTIHVQRKFHPNQKMIFSFIFSLTEKHDFIACIEFNCCEVLLFQDYVLNSIYA